MGLRAMWMCFIGLDCCSRCCHSRVCCCEKCSFFMLHALCLSCCEIVNVNAFAVGSLTVRESFWELLL